jgi:RNA ligase
MQHAGFGIPQIFQFPNLDDILTLAKTLQANKEGFVVRFDNGYRIKIKGDKYCRIAAFLSDMSPINIWNLTLMEADFDSLLVTIPEEFHKDVLAIKDIFNGKYQKILCEIQDAAKRLEGLTFKEIALRNNATYDINKIISYLKYGKTERLRSAIFREFYPKANQLPEFTPSSAINRFGNM